LRRAASIILNPVHHFDLDVVATRGGLAESRHRVHAAVVGEGDRLIGAARQPGHNTFWRSCAKPFQVMPFIQAGGLDELGWGPDQVAIACASHGGEPEHIALVERMLCDIGREEGDLACGPHEPLSQRGAKLVRECGARLSRLHNNCSGKHAAMLARAEITGWPSLTYDRLEHPVQQAVLAYMVKWTDLAPPEMLLAIDGCGVVVFGGPLECLARAYARLGRAYAAGDDIPRIVVSAMVSHPFLVGGSDRFDSVLMEETEGRVLSKVGTEGTHALAVPELGIGIAIKSEDGAQRAQFPAALRILQRFEVLPMELSPRLTEFLRRPVRNSRGEEVGEVLLAEDYDPTTIRLAPLEALPQKKSQRARARAAGMR
jgi:L-asparaginase II